LNETDLHYRPLSAIGAAIAQGAASPVDVTRHTLARIDSLDSRLHSYFTVTAERALEDAHAAEREIAAGRYRGPLHGVPIGVKDLCDTAGVRTTAGTRVMANRVPTQDATVVARLRRAGAVILGKLATTEGAYAEHHPDYTPPVNPWNARVWTGVSSSGSGVATAAGLCFGALGSDTGGSIRFPSAMNGVVGLKPTYGRVPLRGVFPMATSLDHVGPICRNALDAAILLQVIAGADADDPTSASTSVPDYAAAVRSARDDGIRDLRIGVVSASAAADLDTSICLTVRTAVDVLRAAGANVVEVAWPAVAGELAQQWAVTCGVEMLLAHAEFFPARADEYGPGLRFFLEMARSIPATEYARVHLLRLRFGEELRRLFDAIDVLACPTVGVHAPAGLSTLDPEVLVLMGKLMRFTAPFNYSGSPTISVPCGVVESDGVPASLQLVARHFDEATLLRAASAYERSAGSPRHPPV
jgi:amidase